MRLLLLSTALLCSFNVFAAFPPAAVGAHMPKPKYPPELVNEAGKVRVSLNIHNDGSVSDVKVLRASREAFGVAAKAAAEQWRFQPWTVTADSPAVVDAQNTMVFTPDRSTAYTAAVSAIESMLSQRCSALNDEVVKYRSQYPDRPLSSLSTFAMTSAALLMQVFTGERNSEDGAQLNHELISALPEVVRRCKGAPTEMYGVLLPKSVKHALWLPE